MSAILKAEKPNSSLNIHTKSYKNNSAGPMKYKLVQRGQSEEIDHKESSVHEISLNQLTLILSKTNQFQANY